MKKNGIKDFVEGYKLATDNLKKDYIKENLEVKTYLPFNLKMVLAEKIADIALFERKEKIDENGVTVREKTGVVRQNSLVSTLLFYRCIIENYTNLRVETDGFHEEYDLLKQSGLFAQIVKMIPEEELGEFSSYVDMKLADTLSYYNSTQKFVSDQVERFGTLVGVTLQPLLEKVADQLDELDADHIDKLAKIIATGAKLKVLK